MLGIQPETIDCGYIQLSTIPSTAQAYYATTTNDKRMVRLPNALFEGLISSDKLHELDESESFHFDLSIFENDAFKLTEFLSRVMLFADALENVDIRQPTNVRSLKEQFIYPFDNGIKSNYELQGICLVDMEIYTSGIHPLLHPMKEKSTQDFLWIGEHNLSIKLLGGSKATVRTVNTYGRTEPFEEEEFTIENFVFVGKLTGLELFDYDETEETLSIDFTYRKQFHSSLKQLTARN